MGEWERVLSAFYSVALRTFSLSSCGPLFPPSSLSYKYSRFRGTREVTAKRFYLFFYSISIRTFSLSSCGPLFPPSLLSYKYSTFRGTREVKAKRFLTQYHLEPLFLFTPIDIYIYIQNMQKGLLRVERVNCSWYLPVLWGCLLMQYLLQVSQVRHHQLSSTQPSRDLWMQHLHPVNQTISFLVLVLTIFNEGGLIWHLSQSFIRPSIYFSLIVKSCSNLFLEPTSTK